MPLLDPMLFFAVMCVLQVVDAWSTAKALRGGAGEANGVLRRIMGAIGVNEALFLMKAAFLVWLWFHPLDAPVAQWVLLTMFVAVAVNNLRVLKKIGAL